MNKKFSSMFLAVALFSAMLPSSTVYALPDWVAKATGGAAALGVLGYGHKEVADNCVWPLFYLCRHMSLNDFRAKDFSKNLVRNITRPYAAYQAVQRLDDVFALSNSKWHQRLADQVHYFENHPFIGKQLGKDADLQVFLHDRYPDVSYDFALVRSVVECQALSEIAVATIQEIGNLRDKVQNDQEMQEKLDALTAKIESFLMNAANNSATFEHYMQKSVDPVLYADLFASCVPQKSGDRAQVVQGMINSFEVPILIDMCLWELLSVREFTTKKIVEYETKLSLENDRTLFSRRKIVPAAVYCMCFFVQHAIAKWAFSAESMVDRARNTVESFASQPLVVQSFAHAHQDLRDVVIAAYPETPSDLAIIKAKNSLAEAKKNLKKALERFDKAYVTLAKEPLKQRECQITQSKALHYLENSSANMALLEKMLLHDLAAAQA